MEAGKRGKIEPSERSTHDAQLPGSLQKGIIGRKEEETAMTMDERRHGRKKEKKK